MKEIFDAMISMEDSACAEDRKALSAALWKLRNKKSVFSLTKQELIDASKVVVDWCGNVKVVNFRMNLKNEDSTVRELTEW